MVKLRLIRTGKKNAPSYRIAAMDSRTKRNGRVIENLGFYDPKTKPTTIKFDRKRVDYWLSQGAQMTAVVKKLLKK
ncbi:30S ribosomal protein S16 [Microgenomates group bacterium RBG_19FT_COMBO_39_10]|nr:MAG: 30S ribosomal protein S16 [Microgenomates group bacterium RBG_19FT_COMBO_39_10]